MGSSSSRVPTSRRLSRPTAEDAWRDCPVRSISRSWIRPASPNWLTNSIMRSHSSRRMQRKKRSARCSIAACEVRRNTRIRSCGSFGKCKASSMNSGSRFSTPMRGRRSLTRTGRCFATLSMAAHTSPSAGKFLQLAASWLRRTKAALSRLCCSGSGSLANCSPTLRIAVLMSEPPGPTKRSAIWLKPMAVLRRGSASLASRQFT